MSKYRNKDEVPQVQVTALPIAIAAIFCVGLPAFITAIAPISYVHLSRHEGLIEVKTKRCLFFWIPYKRDQLRGVTKVEDRFNAGSFNPNQRTQTRTRSEDQSFILIKTETSEIEIPVSPVNVSDKIDQMQAFIDGKDVETLNLACVSNWKFSVIIAIPLCMLTLIYVIGLGIGLLRWLKVIKR